MVWWAGYIPVIIVGMHSLRATNILFASSNTPSDSYIKEFDSFFTGQTDQYQAHTKQWTSPKRGSSLHQACGNWIEVTDLNSDRAIAKSLYTGVKTLSVLYSIPIQNEV